MMFKQLTSWGWPSGN